MKTLLIISSILLLVSCNNKAGKKDEKTTTQEQSSVTETTGFGLANINLEPSLKNRVKEYFQYTMSLDFDKLMGYIYPKIFEQLPREQMIAELKRSFDSEQMKAQIDSIHVDKTSPPFKVEDGEYVKIYYTMKMVFDFKGDLEEDKKIHDQMAGRFGQENVKMDPETGFVTVWQKDSMIAAKDKISKDWTFISAKEEMVDVIFSDAVLDKLDELE